MTDPDSRRAVLEEQRAAMRAQVDRMLTELRSRTEELRDAQAAVAGVTGSAASGDRRVSATVDSGGLLAELRLAGDVFDRSTPDQLAAVITDVVRRATQDVRAQVAAIFEPVTRAGPDRVDLRDLVDLDAVDDHPAGDEVGPPPSYLREA